MLNAEVVSFAAAPAARISLCVKPDRGNTHDSSCGKAEDTAA